MKTNLLINNKSVLGEADGYDVINPVNSEIITTVTQSSVNQVNEAVTAAKIAFTKLVPQFAGPQRNNGCFTFLINFNSINISFYLFLKIFFYLPEENFLYTFSKI